MTDQSPSVPTPRTEALFWSFHTQDDMVDLAKRLESELVSTQMALDQMTRDALVTARDRDEWMCKAMRYSQALACI